jgi:hypothetical protein
MPQTLEEFVRGTPFAAELERLRAVEEATRRFLDAPMGEPRRAAMLVLRAVLLSGKAVG